MKDSDLQSLANMVAEAIKDDFRRVHLSGNLMNTITVTKSESGYKVEIPAQIYDMKLYQTRKVIVYKAGSYASQLNDEGSEFFDYIKWKWVMPRNHIGYAERGCQQAADQWAKMNGKEVRVR